MTPEERIAQIAAQRGAEPPRPRPDRIRPQPKEPQPKAPPDPMVGRAAPQAWRKIPDAFGSMSHRQQIHALETRIAARAIARCLGTDWTVESFEDRRFVTLRHRDGFGISFGPDFRDAGRWRAAPLDVYNRDEDLPESITMAGTRTFLDCANDIRRRIIDQGLRDHWERLQADNNRRRADTAADFRALHAATRAAGGHIKSRKIWHIGPEAEIPGGRIGITYNRKVRIDIEADPAQAEQVLAAWRRIREEST